VLKIITEKPDIYRNQRFQPIFLIVFRQMATFSHTLYCTILLCEASLLLFYICTHT